MNLSGLLRRVAEPRPATSGRTCGTCRFFDNDPQSLEARIPGLRSMASATSSVRSDDGLCALHERYLGARATCAAYQPS